MNLILISRTDAIRSGNMRLTFSITRVQAPNSLKERIVTLLRTKQVHSKATQNVSLESRSGKSRFRSLISFCEFGATFRYKDRMLSNVHFISATLSFLFSCHFIRSRKILDSRLQSTPPFAFLYVASSRYCYPGVRVFALISSAH